MLANATVGNKKIDLYEKTAEFSLILWVYCPQFKAVVYVYA